MLIMAECDGSRCIDRASCGGRSLGGLQLGSVGEALGGGSRPAQTYSFDIEDIAYMQVYSNVHSVAGMAGMPIDDIVFDPKIPLPSTLLLSLVAVIGGAEEMRARTAKTTWLFKVLGGFAGLDPIWWAL